MRVNCMSLKITAAFLLQHCCFAVLQGFFFFKKRRASRLHFHGSFNNERGRLYVIEQYTGVFPWFYCLLGGSICHQKKSVCPDTLRYGYSVITKNGQTYIIQLRSVGIANPFAFTRVVWVKLWLTCGSSSWLCREDVREIPSGKSVLTIFS